MKTPERFITAMFWAAEVLGVEMTAARVDGTWATIAHIGEGKATRAVADYVRTAQFPRAPLPFELLRLAGAEETEDDEADATAAWATLQDRLHTLDPQRMIERSRAIALGVAACGGLYALRTGASGEAEHWVMQRFVRAYVGGVRAQRRAQCDAQPGIAEIVAGVAERLAAGLPFVQIGGDAGQPQGSADNPLDPGQGRRHNAGAPEPDTLEGGTET